MISNPKERWVLPYLKLVAVATASYFRQCTDGPSRRWWLSYKEANRDKWGKLIVTDQDPQQRGALIIPGGLNEAALYDWILAASNDMPVCKAGI